MRCAWSDFFECTASDDPFSGITTGAGAPVSRGSMSPSSSSSFSSSPSPMLPAEAHDHPLRPVPAVDVARKRFAGRAADGLLAAEHVPAERLVAVEERVVQAADEVARRVEVHVHLLHDHALLALDLLLAEARVPDHVDEDVERGGRATRLAHLT